jgi:hypothetical protein
MATPDPWLPITADLETAREHLIARNAYQLRVVLDRMASAAYDLERTERGSLGLIVGEGFVEAANGEFAVSWFYLPVVVPAGVAKE